MRLASQGRPSLVASRLAVEQVRASSRALAAIPPLTLALGASTRNDVGATDQDLALSQEIDLFGRTRSLAKLGASDLLVAEARYRSEALGLQTDVLTAFAHAVSSRRRREVATDLLGIAEGLLAATQRRFDEGTVAELQVTRASIEFQRAQQFVQLSIADHQTAMILLAGLLGIAPESFQVEADAATVPAASTGVTERPDVLTLQAEVARANAEASVARAASRPGFSLQLVRSPWSNDRGYFVGRAQFSFSLWDHGRTKNEVKAANLRAEAASKALEDRKSVAAQQLAAVQIEIKSSAERVASFEAILVLAKDLVVKSQKGFSEGFGTQVDVLEATRALRELEQELVEARLQLSLAVVKQYEVSGFLAEVLR
ncbi:MAG: TolC family protein [Nitrospiraceae bacterium]